MNKSKEFHKPLTIQEELQNCPNQAPEEPETVFVGGFPPKTTESKKNPLNNFD